MIPIVEGLAIPDEELVFVASRSGGPGGQNVNKVSSRITLRFNVEESSVLTPEQKKRISGRLASRITKDGILQVTSQRTRSQELNRADAVGRFRALLAAALRKETPRVPTRASKESREKRLEAKRRRTRVKQTRRRKDWDD